MSTEAENAAPLSSLQPGERGRILSLDGLGSHKGRVMEMGLTIGSTVEVVRFAPLGDPMELKVRGANISLRKAEAAGVRVERA